MHAGIRPGDVVGVRGSAARGVSVMMVVLRLASLFLVVATVIPSVAHVLELPGKLRLRREQYLAVQGIYYPGFTVIGAAEPLSILVIATLLALMPKWTTTFWLIAGAFLANALTHVLYWTLTAPVNKVWLRDETLSGSADRFFAAGGSVAETDWTVLRDRWEWSHVYRAAASVAALALLAIALVS
jgi:hypothetical protein